MTSKWLNPVECVQVFMAWKVLGRVSGVNLRRRMVEVNSMIQYCEQKFIRIKQRGMCFWVHISKSLHVADKNIIMRRLRDYHFKRVIVKKSKIVMSTVKPLDRSVVFKIPDSWQPSLGAHVHTTASVPIGSEMLSAVE